mmetsp:Transcript_26917/g.75244  ORF Transcript_26917/g.75244 Transcript_26917/m.75244 type:complete len:276 (-) Transcript_26917:718-1545(-)
MRGANVVHGGAQNPAVLVSLRHRDDGRGLHESGGKCHWLHAKENVVVGIRAPVAQAFPPVVQELLPVLVEACPTPEGAGVSVERVNVVSQRAAIARIGGASLGGQQIGLAAVRDSVTARQVVLPGGVVQPEIFVVVLENGVRANLAARHGKHGIDDTIGLRTRVRLQVSHVPPTSGRHGGGALVEVTQVGHASVFGRTPVRQGHAGLNTRDVGGKVRLGADVGTGVRAIGLVHVVLTVGNVEGIASSHDELRRLHLEAAAHRTRNGELLNRLGGA